jgi:hypothetical protein
LPNPFARLIGTSFLLSSLAACAGAGATTRLAGSAGHDLQAVPPTLLNTTEPPCASIDQRLLDAAMHVVEVSPRTGRVWPGYWSADQAVIIYEPGRSALLVSPSAPAPPFEPVSPEHLPPQLRGRAYLACGALPGLTGNFDTNYAVGNIRAIAVKLEITPYETLEVVFHEGFHEWQKTAFARTTGAGSIGLHKEVQGYLETIRDPRFVASMELERRILAAAVGAQSPAERRQLAQYYLAVKQLRTAPMPVEARHTELNVERKEGSASIVGHEAAAAAYGRPLDRPYGQLWSILAEPPLSLPAGDSAFARFRMRAFGAGAAVAWILTRMNIDWRPELQKGASFETLLHRAVDFDPRSAAALAQQAASRFGMAQLLKDAEQWRATSKEVTETEFYKAHPVRLTIEFPRYENHNPPYKVSGSRLPVVPEKNLTIFMDTHVAELKYGPISLMSEKRPFLFDSRGEPTSYSLSLMMDELPRLTGFDGGSGGTITGADLDIRIGAPAVVERGEKSIKVSIGSVRR